MSPIKQQFDCDDRTDDTAIFYSRMFGDNRIIIIPKDFFAPISETETTYILTLKKD